MKLIDLLEEGAANKPETAAIIYNDMRIEYRRLLFDVYQLRDYLKAVHCRSGFKAAVLLENTAEYIAGFFAISAAEGTIVPLSARMTIYELSSQIQNADVSIVITNPELGRILSSSQDKNINVTVISVHYDNHSDLQIKIMVARNSYEDADNRDVALMVPTSGSTGKPKIVMLTDRQLISNMVAYRSRFGFRRRNSVYCALQFHHIYCICAQILTHISLADTFVLSNKPFFIKDFFKAVEKYKITISAFVPYMAILMSDFQHSYDYNHSSLKYITISGAKTPKATYLNLTSRFKDIQFINTYGMSEAGSRISIAAPNPAQFPPESVGRPIPTVSIRIVDTEGSILPAETIGEIEVKSSGVMKGYYMQPELTSMTLIEGWLKTGDLGKVDNDGNLFLVGRKKDIIICGGENIYPQEIEECLLEYPAVKEAAVIAQKDRLLQEIPCAFIVKHKEHNSSRQIDIIKYCMERLSSYKVPHRVIFLEEMPMLTSSKINRLELRKMLSS